MLFLQVGLIVLLWVGNVWACPACLPAGKPKSFTQTLIALFVMATIPILAFLIVFWRIQILQKNERRPS